MRVEILGGPFDGEVHEVEGNNRHDVLVALPTELNPFEPEGDPLDPKFERYRLPVRKGKAYWNERVEVL